MLKLLFITILAGAGMFYPGDRLDIDYQNKSIFKTLEKELGETAELTEMEISADTNFTPDEQGKYFKIVGDQSSEIAFVYVGRVNTCRSGGCSAPGTNTGNFSSEYFDYFIFFGETGAVKLVKIFNYAATKGQEVTAKSWLRQFRDYDGSGELSVGKQIDGISGATISVYSITADIEFRTNLLRQIIDKKSALQISSFN